MRYQLRYIPIARKRVQSYSIFLNYKHFYVENLYRYFFFSIFANCQTTPLMYRIYAFAAMLFISLCAANGKNPQIIQVQAGDAESLLSAIEQANKQNADSATSDWLYIMIPNGTYDLGDRTLTTITGHHVALIGESMNGTIIKNKPAIENESISKTATLRLITSDTYLQDITLKNDLDYYHSGRDGRAVCLQDKGTRTICKRVRLLSYQDTYYSNCNTGQMYMENCEIHGTVDFICGPADVYFNRCTIVTERRKLDGSGRCVIAAPRTNETPWGYIFESCVIYNRVSNFAWARGWQSTPHCIWLNTRLMSPEKLLPTRFEPKGMRTVQSDFKEYNTMDAEGRNITPESNVVTFTLKTGESNTVETILTAAEARKYKLEDIFPEWQPQCLVEKMNKTIAKAKRMAGWQ